MKHYSLKRILSIVAIAGVLAAVTVPPLDWHSFSGLRLPFGQSHLAYIAEVPRGCENRGAVDPAIATPGYPFVFEHYGACVPKIYENRLAYYLDIVIIAAFYLLVAAGIEKLYRKARRV